MALLGRVCRGCCDGMRIAVGGGVGVSLTSKIGYVVQGPAI